MKTILIILLLLSVQQVPVIRLNKLSANYGESIKIHLYNSTRNTVYYYLDLDVLVDGFWGPADSDILNPAKDKIVSYTIRSLKPSEQTSIYYKTRLLSKNYVNTYSTYRISMYCMSNSDGKIENVAYSSDFKITNRNKISHKK